MHKSLWGIAAVAVILLGFWFIFEKEEKSTDSSPIRLGAVLSLTGVAAPFGEMSRLGIQLAVKEINEEEGVEGRMVEVIYEDDRTDPKAAVGAYQKLVSVDKVDGIIGSNFDFVTQPLFSLAKGGDVAVISPSNTRIPGAFDTNEKSFVMLADFSRILDGMQGYLKDTEFTQAGVVRFESAFGEEITRSLDRMVVALGKPRVINESYKEIGNNDFRSIIIKLKQQGVDLIFADMSGNDLLTFVAQGKQLGFTPKIITHGYIREGLANENADPKQLDGIVMLDWETPAPAFTKAFMDVYGKDPVNSADHAYEAVYLLADALSNVATKDVAVYLEKTRFTTPNGPFSFTKEHAALETPVALFIVKDGKLVDYR